MSERQIEIREKALSQKHTLSLQIERAARPDDATKDDRTIELSFASDIPHEHFLWANWEYVDIALSMDPKAVRTERLENGAALLMGHDTYDWRSQVGVVDSFSIEKKEGKARAVVRFSESADGEQVYKDVLGGIRQCVSVGFMIHKLTLVEQKDRQKGEIDLYRADDWEPYEISIVSVPADISVGVGRAADLNPLSIPAQTRAIPNSTTEKTMKDENVQPPAAPAVETRSPELAIIDEIKAFGDAFGKRDLADAYVQENVADNGTFTGTKAGFFARVKAATPPATQQVPVMDPAEQALRQAGIQANTQLARTLPRHGKVTSFKGENAAIQAYRFGQWLLGRALFDPNFGLCRSAEKYCLENGLITRAMGEDVNETGGYLVPPEFSNDLIDLRELFGVFRQYAKNEPMASDTKFIPRRTTGLTAYFTAEAGAGTPSDAGWDQIELVAKKLFVLARYSSEVSEDAIIDFGNNLASEIAYAFAEKEDQCGFNGDGTSTYGGMVGARAALLGVDSTIANIAGLQVGSGNAYSELALVDFEGVAARLPIFAERNAKWFVSKKFYWNVMVKLALAAGGNTVTEIEDMRRQIYLGYPVVFSQVMPVAEANSQVCAILGDLSMGALLGTRRDTRIAFSEHSRFANDQIEVKGTERFDISVHGVGDTTNAGPVVGLITAAS